MLGNPNRAHRRAVLDLCTALLGVVDVEVLRAKVVQVEMNGAEMKCVAPAHAFMIGLGVVVVELLCADV